MKARVCREGKKSIAIAVRIQPKDKTLTDAEIEALAQKIVAAVTKATARASQLTHCHSRMGELDQPSKIRDRHWMAGSRPAMVSVSR